MFSLRWRRKASAGRQAVRWRPGIRPLAINELEQRIALTNLPAGFVESTVAGGLSAPTSMALAPDGRIFVTEQTGAVRVIKNGALLSTPFMSLSVNSAGERGLLGLAFDPNFASNQFIYVYYTTSTTPIHNRVSRFTANGDVVAAGSETILMDLENLTGATNHNGGALHFGVDGKLYIAVGENATASNSQTLANRLGKLLRINSDGSIPTDNPFFNTATGDNRAIWALGLRNPFTFAVQPGTGRIFINDVGAATWEEVNNGVTAGNYGWPTTEGPTTNPNFISPVFAYRSDDAATGACAIAGGAFYNPATRQFPMGYSGDYFFADLCGQFIRRLDPITGEVNDFASSTPFGTVDLDIAADGTLLYLSRGANAVLRISFIAGGPKLAVGSGPGTAAQVRVVEAATGIEQFSVLPFGGNFSGGVRVAMGDVNEDNVDDIIAAAGPGGGPHVRVFDGVTGHVIRDFFAFAGNFTGGVFVAAVDFNADNLADIVTAAGAGGGPHVKVFNSAGGPLLADFFAYGAGFTGGVHVAAGNLDALGAPEIITGAGPGGGPHVRVFQSNGTAHPSFPGGFVYNTNFTGGVFVAAGDVDGDGRAEIITGAGAGGGPHVKVFNQSFNVISEFFAYASNFTGGVRVAARELTGDSRLEVITAAGPSGGPHVRAFSVPPPVERASFFPFALDFTGGVFVGGTARLSGSGFSAASPTAIDRTFESISQEEEVLLGPELDDHSLVPPPTTQKDEPTDAVLCALCSALS